jgi:NAD kinase
MEYFVIAADDSVAAEYERLLDDGGYAVRDEYAADCVVLSVGGDGSILYNARRYDEPTILPVAGAGSEANTVDVDEDRVSERLATLEDGDEGTDYRLEPHRKLRASSDGAPIREGFPAINDVHVHHASPVRAAKFAVRVLDRANANDGGTGHDDGRTDDDGGHDEERAVYEAEKVIGDGVLVATPFGASGYYRSITNGVFDAGLGVAFNNVHKPADAPRSISLSPAGRVETELLTTTRSASAVLARDDDTAVYELTPGERVSISLSDRVARIVRFDAPSGRS